MLKFIEKKSVISQLLHANSKSYKKELYEYWKNMGTTPDTTYNPLMEEYYPRIGYAAKAFAVFSDKSGIETYLGKFYIQFGKPQEVKLVSNKYGKVVETLTYIYHMRDLVFVDIDGTGNFRLRE